MQWALLGGHAECVRLLTPVSDTEKWADRPLSISACYGHAECVKELIALVDPKHNGSEALAMAAKHGHLECVKLLLPVSHNILRKQELLMTAIEAGNGSVVAAMFDFNSRLSAVLDLAEEAAKAAKRGHQELAEVLRSTAEKWEMLRSTTEAKDSGGQGPRRL